MTETRPEHSPLGASSAERWMNCPGSTTLIQALGNLPETDEPSYRAEGTAMHEAAAHCLRLGLDTWEVVGQSFGKTPVEITDELAEAVQVYLDYVRAEAEEPNHPDNHGALHATQVYVEYGISSQVHPLFYGTVDWGALFPHKIKVVDFKGGAGIVVEVEDNPQLKYYAFGLLEELERGRHIGDEFPIHLAIVQPRAYSAGLAIREWETTAGALREWVKSELVPAMCRVEYDNTLDAGEHCRFCPAKLVCPLLTSLFGAAAKHNPREVISLDDESLGRSYGLIQGVKFYTKALEEEAFSRLNSGKVVPGAILVRKKANRVLKTGAEDIAKARFGEDAYTKPELKSAAEFDKLGPKGKEFTKQWAFTPDTGLTVAVDDGTKVAVTVKPATQVFAAAAASLAQEDHNADPA